MTMRTRVTSQVVPIVFAVAVACLLASCYVPSPSVSHAAVYVEGPPIVLHPGLSVVYSSRVSCDYVYGIDYDVFHIGGYFYTHHRGRWYCSHRPGAAWVVVGVAYVPEVIRRGPPARGWRSSSPGQARRVTSFRSSLPPGLRSAAKSRGGRPASPRAARPSAPGQMKKRAPIGPWVQKGFIRDGKPPRTPKTVRPKPRSPKAVRSKPRSPKAGGFLTRPKKDEPKSGRGGRK